MDGWRKVSEHYKFDDLQSELFVFTAILIAILILIIRFYRLLRLHRAFLFDPSLFILI